MGRDSSSHPANPAHEASDGAARNALDSAMPSAETPPDDGRTDEPERAGQDERKRGWFWHWNGVVTQYAPLIGLKGIGLLNSYTVWTDRREDSPHRGYAFPSQQSEANFYGEDRAELITINKILVALDLIEIRKEMVRKTDAQGRRWKVPQNLYRVKDRPNGLDLTAADVIRVVELAERDKAVYRYIRKLFSAKFEPIDRNNVWRQLLIEVGEHPTWRKLAFQAAKQEARASARTRAGHRSRARQQNDGQAEGDNDDGSEGAAAVTSMVDAALLTSGHDNGRVSANTEHGMHAGEPGESIADRASNASGPADEPANSGSQVVDGPANDGFDTDERGDVADVNTGRASSVEPGNTTYYESSTTTTTTTSAPKSSAGDVRASPDNPQIGFPLDAVVDDQPAPPPEETDTRAAAEPPVDLIAGDAGSGVAAPQRGMADQPGGGPMGDPNALVVSLYEAANDRPATGLERILLSELEQDAAGPAAAAGSTGPEWVAAALREAVGSGSAFVAPKRIREIVNRWSADGAGPRGSALNQAPAVTENRHARRATDDRSPISKLALGRTRDAIASDEQSGNEPVRIGRTDAQQGEQIWSVVLDLLAAGDSPGDLFRLRAVVPLGERGDGVFLLGAPTRLAARLLDGRYRSAVEQALSSLLSSPVRIAIIEPSQWTVTD